MTARSLKLLMVASCALSMPFTQSPARGSGVTPGAEITIAAEDASRESYILRALKPPLDPALQGKHADSGGTGFFVSPHHILTNYHVVAACKVLTAEFGRDGETPSVVTIAASDPAHDLAALQGSLVSTSPVAFEKKMSRVDASDLSVIGFPVYGLPRQTPSIIPAKARPDAINATGGLFEFRGDIHPGHSGSPLLDEYAAVIGVVARKVETVSTYRKTGRVINNVAFAIPNSVTLAFLDRNRIPHRLDAPEEDLDSQGRMQRYSDGVVHVACWR
jgi:S1-C subfamily serine protease